MGRRKEVMTIWKMNEKVVITECAYADYSVTGVFVVMKEFEEEALIAEYTVIFKALEPPLRSSMIQAKFLEWLQKQKYLKPLTWGEWNIGDGGTLESRL